MTPAWAKTEIDDALSMLTQAGYESGDPGARRRMPVAQLLNEVHASIAELQHAGTAQDAEETRAAIPPAPDWSASRRRFAGWRRLLDRMCSSGFWPRSAPGRLGR
jgi:hypothetical protein